MPQKNPAFASHDVVTAALGTQARVEYAPASVSARRCGGGRDADLYMDRTHAIDFSWLLKLRWGAAAGQIAIIACVERWMAIELPLRPLSALIAIELATNAAAELWARSMRDVPEVMLGALMLLDVALLTGLLYFTGGPFNPFSFLYLVNIALAAVVLSPRWTWTLVACSLGCFGALFFDHVPLAAGAHGSEHHGGSMWTHVQGMWVAFGVAAAFIVYFIQRVTRALADREAELAAARSRTARHEKLASLATLAAGAAHELATPLSTIAVVARELERQLTREGAGSEVAADARLIRQQVERCREILVQMAADAGESAGESIVPVRVDEIVDAALGPLPDRARVAVSIDDATRSGVLHVPSRALVRALRGVVKNARQASGATSRVELQVRADGEAWRFEVSDRGAGMGPEVLARASEPFFTTKHGNGSERGMGLGLFLTRAVLEGLGGRLELASVPGRGTTATLVLPRTMPGTVGAGAADAMDDRG